MSSRLRLQSSSENPMSIQSERLAGELAIITGAEYVYGEHFLASVTLVLSLFGVATNSVNIKTFLNMGAKDGVTCTFLYLSISDLGFVLTFSLLACFRIPTTVYFYHRGQLYLDPLALCILTAHIATIFSVVSLLITSYLAIARCMCVVRPLHFKNTFTRRKASIVAGISLGFAFTIYSPVLAKTAIVYGFDPSLNASRLVLSQASDAEEVKNVVWTVTNLILPIGSQVLILSCLLVLVAALKASSQFRQQTTSDRAAPHTPGVEEKTNPDEDYDKMDRRIPATGKTGDKEQTKKLGGKEAKVAKQVMMISAMYVICNTPQIFVVVWVNVDTGVQTGGLQEYLYYLVTGLCAIFVVVNKSVNFLIYFKWNSSFRNHLCGRP